MYCAVQYEGKTWHLFNAKRMPLGRIARLASEYLRGKHKPTYVARKGGVDGDFVVIVNSEEQYMTGRKASQKIYRNYTGYVGHLRTTSMKHMLEKKPEFVL
jgi:large subunit ribosomal protein L13